MDVMQSNEENLKLKIEIDNLNQKLIDSTSKYDRSSKKLETFKKTL